MYVCVCVCVYDCIDQNRFKHLKGADVSLKIKHKKRISYQLCSFKMQGRGVPEHKHINFKIKKKKTYRNSWDIPQSFS